MTMNCGSPVAASDPLVHSSPRSKSVLISLSAADFDLSIVPDAGETSNDSTHQSQMSQYDRSTDHSSSGRQSSVLLPGSKQST